MPSPPHSSSPRRRLRRGLLLALAAAPLLFASAAARAAGEPPGCGSEDPAACLYQPAAVYATAIADRTFVDASRGGHVVPIRIHYPLDASGPRPVVVWHHGGRTLDERDDGSYPFVSGQHGELFARAGYVAVEVVRTKMRARPTAAQLRVCKANDALAPNACQVWYGFHVQGPRNTPFVVHELGLLPASALPGFTGTLDLTRIAVGGYSGGSELVLNHAGATQRWPRLVQASVPVPGAVAYLGAAPRGPMYAGFDSGFDNDAYQTIGAAPFLFLLARNEEPGEPGATGGAGRSPGWLGATPGDKLMSWDTTDAVSHANLGLDECTASAVQADHCRWMAALTLAFVEAYVGERQQALDWLKSEALGILTGDSIELYRR